MHKDLQPVEAEIGLNSKEHAKLDTRPIFVIQ